MSDETNTVDEINQKLANMNEMEIAIHLAQQAYQRVSEQEANADALAIGDLAAAVAIIAQKLNQSHPTKPLAQRQPKQQPQSAPKQTLMQKLPTPAYLFVKAAGLSMLQELSNTFRRA